MKKLKTKYSTILIKNKKFDNLTQACKYFKVGYSFISNRIHKQGMTIEQAFQEPSKVRTIKIKNKKFKSINHACTYYKLTPENVYYRLNKGWTLEEAFELIPRKSSTECKGLVYKISNSRNSKIYIGITIGRLNDRFNQHKAAARRGKNTKICRAIRKYGPDKFTIKVIKRVSCRKELAKEEIRLIKKYNSIVMGYNTQPGGSSNGEKHGKPIVFDGIEFISTSLLAAYLNLPLSTLNHRIKNSLPLNQSLGRGSAKGNKILYRGKIYKSVKHLGEHLNLSKSGIHYRLKMGYCLNGPSNKTGQKGYYTGELV